MVEIPIKEWDGGGLTGTWILTRKIDGVRAFLTPDGAFSRQNKPLYNLDAHLPTEGIRDVEVFLGSWAETVSAVRSQTPKRIAATALYTLDPVDERLYLGKIKGPSAWTIKGYLNAVLQSGFEGLVLRQEDTWIKVKPTRTFDVTVLRVIEGRGKNRGKMGSLVTELGKVGTGFSDLDRIDWWEKREQRINRVIEVECMELTTDGKFRHPRFIRIRHDKGGFDVIGS